MTTTNKEAKVEVDMDSREKYILLGIYNMAMEKYNIRKKNLIERILKSIKENRKRNKW